AGHGGEDMGNAEGTVSEKELTLQFAKVLRQQLRQAGIEVLLVREDDRFVPLNDRAAYTQNRGEALFISLHLNAAESSSAHGFEVYIPNNEHSTYRKSLRFANATDRILAKNGVETRGVKTANFTVLKNSESPAVLMELGFLSSAKDMEQLQSAAYQEQLCGWIVKAVEEYAR
ncbi:MAG: N-acetylmuramoyl-L-alanine amidase, partial [Bacteroidota bacterium]